MSFTTIAVEAITFAYPAACAMGCVAHLGNKVYAKKATDEMSSYINGRFAGFLRDHNIGCRVHVVERIITFQRGAFSGGEPSSPLSIPQISVARGLKDLDPEAFGYLFKREFYHLENHDYTVRYLAAWCLTCTPAIYQFFSEYQSLFALASLMGIGASFAYNYYLNYKADAFAIRHSTVDELKGGLCFYIALEDDINEAQGFERYFLRAMPILPNLDEGNGQPLFSWRFRKIVEALHIGGIRVHTQREKWHALSESVEKVPLLGHPLVMTIFDLDAPDVTERISRLRGLIWQLS